jgi:hypothetical protein
VNARALIDVITESSREDYAFAARHLTKVARHLDRQAGELERNPPGPLELDRPPIFKKDAADVRKLSHDLHHGRANAARRRFYHLDTAVGDETLRGLVGHKAGKGSVQRALGTEFSR